jgi:DNA end-binding protein Ku
MPTSNPRSIASLTISFGLVAIPVKLYSATVASERISSNLLRAKDGSRVKQQYIAVNDGRIVERSEMTKGYEFAKDQFVIFSGEELKDLEDTTTHSIDISQFVPLDTVDPVYFAGTYYLAPDKGGAKPYSLLVAALAFNSSPPNASIPRSMSMSSRCVLRRQFNAKSRANKYHWRRLRSAAPRAM